jgi:hypothetical protein
VNNAGVLRYSTFTSAPDLDAARQEMETNYFGTLPTHRAAALAAVPPAVGASPARSRAHQREHPRFSWEDSGSRETLGDHSAHKSPPSPNAPGYSRREEPHSVLGHHRPHRYHTLRPRPEAARSKALTASRGASGGGQLAQLSRAGMQTPRSDDEDGVDISIPPPQAMHLVCNRARCHGRRYTRGEAGRLPAWRRLSSATPAGRTSSWPPSCAVFTSGYATWKPSWPG